MRENFVNKPVRNKVIFAPTRSQNQAVAWLCIFLLFAQNLVPLQSHTRLAKDQFGVLVSVCTLEGTKQVQLDLPPIAGGEKSSSEELPSAAVKFSTLLAESHLSTLEFRTDAVLIKVGSATESLIPSFRNNPHGWYPIRAPPLV